MIRILYIGVDHMEPVAATRPAGSEHVSVIYSQLCWIFPHCASFQVPTGSIPC